MLLCAYMCTYVQIGDTTGDTVVSMKALYGKVGNVELGMSAQRAIGENFSSFCSVITCGKTASQYAENRLLSDSKYMERVRIMFGYFYMKTVRKIDIAIGAD